MAAEVQLWDAVQGSRSNRSKRTFTCSAHASADHGGTPVVGDVIFVAVIVAFFVLMMLIVRWLHPMVIAASTDEAEVSQGSDDDQDLEPGKATSSDGRG